LFTALHSQIEAEYGVLDHGQTVIIEMARASGLELLAPWRSEAELAALNIAANERDPLLTSTFGTGQLLLHALDMLPQLKRVLMCVGGSATNDGGAGFAAALGYKFMDADGGVIERPGLLIRLFIIKNCIQLFTLMTLQVSSKS
jgi:glycerate kinase